MAKAILISAEDRKLTFVDVEGKGDIQRLIGFDTLESDTIDGVNDRLYFDEECFIRGANGRFQIDRLIPVSGKGVIANLAGDDIALDDVSLSIEDVKARIRFD